MNKDQLTKEQIEGYKADGFGKSKPSEGEGLIKIWINVRKDSQIPSFDALTEIKFYIEGLEDQEKYLNTLLEMVNDGGGMFIEDILKLKERDVLSMLGETIDVGKSFPIPSLRALQKAVCNYFKNSGQESRYKKATEKVICSCRHVTDIEILDEIAKGKTTYEEIQRSTGLGTGCNCCYAVAKKFIETHTGKIS